MYFINFKIKIPQVESPYNENFGIPSSSFKKLVLNYVIRHFIKVSTYFFYICRETAVLFLPTPSFFTIFLLKESTILF